MVKRILEYMSVTYGTRVWVTEMVWDRPPRGWRAYMFDFSDTSQSPFYMDAIPDYEKRWFIGAIIRDPLASISEQKGLKWFWFIDPRDKPVANTETLPVEFI